MGRKLPALLLALTLCLGLPPGTASAADADLPDWYFLFAIFKNVDADVKDGDGAAAHVTYTIPQEEIDILQDIAGEFEAFMDQVGVMRAHVDVVVIDAPITELYNEFNGGSYLGWKQAPSLLKTKVDPDRYDHVFCILNLDVRTNYAGVTGTPLENGTGLSSINHRNWERFQADFLTGQKRWYPQLYSHEFLHFMEQLSRKWGAEFNEHLIVSNFYTPTDDNWKSCHTDMILNQVRGNSETGTGVAPAAWQYPPHVLRTMTKLIVPSGVTGIGDSAFRDSASLTEVTIPASVVSIGPTAFCGCSNLADLTISSGVASIGVNAFRDNTSLTEVTIPASVTEIGAYAFSGCTSLTNLTISCGVTSIGASAFRGDTSLTEVAIPAGVASIGPTAFYGCSGLTDVTIPSSVTDIGDWAFRDTGVKNVYYAGTAEQWKAIRIGAYNGPLTKANIRYLSEGTLGEELAWSYDAGAGQVTVTGGAVSPAAPVYAAVYGEGGRMTGVTVITASGGKAVVGNGFDRMKLIWIDRNAAPKCPYAEIRP